MEDTLTAIAAERPARLSSVRLDLGIEALLPRTKDAETAFARSLGAWGMCAKELPAMRAVIVTLPVAPPREFRVYQSSGKASLLPQRRY